MKLETGEGASYSINYADGFRLVCKMRQRPWFKWHDHQILIKTTDGELLATHVPKTERKLNFIIRSDLIKTE